MIYTNYTNLDSHFTRTYEPGDRLVRGWSDTLPGWNDIPAETQAQLLAVFHEDIHRYAEDIYARHNRDDRPDGQLCPSLSVGDVIVIGEVAVSVAMLGFKIVQLDASDILPTTYLETVR